MKNFGSHLDTYFKTEQEIYEHFGYDPEGIAHTFVDYRDMFWAIIHHDTWSEVRYAKEKKSAQNASGKYYSDEICLPPIHDKSVYRRGNYVMMMVMPETPNVISLYIFKYGKKVEDKKKHYDRINT